MNNKSTKYPCNLIIAEIGSVHDGSFGNACKLIELGARCGANAIKFQTHIASEETLRDAPSPSYFRQEPRFEYFERTSFSKDQWEQLKITCERNNVLFVSSPFSISAVKLLNSIDISIFKVPSGEVTNIPLLESIAGTGKPTLLSSGMSSWEELDKAVEILSNSCPLTLMQCTSMYPCPPEKVGLNIINEIRNRYGSQIGLGFSDHTLGYAAGISASALGANVIEKHLTYSQSMYGSDAINAMEPKEFSTFCKSIKEVWKMKSNPIDKNNLEDYKEMKEVFEKSIVSSREIDAGKTITFNDLAYKKPGTGISSSKYKELIGKTIKYNIKPDHIFSESDFL